MKKINTLNILLLFLCFACEEDIMPISTTEIKFQAISSGDHHILAIDTDGNLWTWGFNSYGELGNGTTTEDNLEGVEMIETSVKFKAISAGNCYSLAIDESGYLWAWGNNSCGQLGDGTTTNRSYPVKIQSNTKFNAIAASKGGLFENHHTLAIDESGQLWAWGYNSCGQIGDGTIVNKTSPIAIKTDTKFVSVAAAWWHSLAIDESGNLWTWGSNSDGQIGNGKEGITSKEIEPVCIMSGTIFKYIDAGSSSSYAIDESGNLWVWGENTFGELGNGKIEDTSDDKISVTEPEQIGIGTKFIAVSYADPLTGAGALDENGNIWRLKYSCSKITSTNVVYKMLAIGLYCIAIDDSGTLYYLDDF